MLIKFLDCPRPQEVMALLCLWSTGFGSVEMFIPCCKDMTADDLGYVFLREVIRLKGCLRQIVSDRDKLFPSQAWKELGQRFKIEMHQTVANRP